MSKMTDKEIIKALKVCAKNETPFCCGECELGENNSSCDCVDRLLKLSLDLINRQQAEIKRLKEELEIRNQKRASIFEISNAYERGRTKAIKEFADRLKEQAKANERNGTICGLEIDCLEKEMVGEGK